MLAEGNLLNASCREEQLAKTQAEAAEDIRAFRRSRAAPESSALFAMELSQRARINKDAAHR